jgi:hypothetical protein
MVDGTAIAVKGEVTSGNKKAVREEGPVLATLTRSHPLKGPPPVFHSVYQASKT